MLAKMIEHPVVGFSDYERRLKSMQSVMQSIQQAFLGTRERAVIVLEGWDTAGKGGIVRRLGWALDPRSLKVFPIAAPLSHERADTTCNDFGKSCLTLGKSLFSTALGTGVFWSREWRVLPARENGKEVTTKSMNLNV